jgi:predicted outer membrane repeat protein
VYTIQLAAATPVFSIPAGTYTSVQTVTITDATAGATIYYTTDGTTPTTASKTYAGAISISATTTLQAIATATGSSTSSIASAVYTIQLAAATPVFSIPAGTYTSVQTVTITDATAGATIYYTTDGSTPSTASKIYSGPISVSLTETINAIASLSGQLSSVASAAYVINLPPTSLSVYSGSGQSVLVNDAYTAPIQIQVLNATSNPVAGVTVSFSAPATGPSATLSSSSCTTDSSGLCSILARANGSTGTFTLTASAGALNTAFTLTNTGPHSYIVTVATDNTTGIASNCLDQASSPGSGNSNCSLRDAMAAAAATATSTQTATITFAQTAATTITLSNGTLNIPSYTVIQGATSGAGLTLTNLISVSGGGSTTVFTEAAGVIQAAINNLTITKGSSGLGGGIYMLGSLAVNNSTFSFNQASTSGGAISNNGGNLSIFGSTFANNVAQNSAGYGGGIDNFSSGTITVSNSTFFGNQGGNGGAIYSHGTATITDSTISGNIASYGGGVYNLGTMTVTNSIVNGNSNENCGGLYCAPLWAYVVFSAATPSPVDSANINIAFSDSLGNHFSQTYLYGQYSSAQSVAAAFGPEFYENLSGLDTTAITGESFGTLLVITPENGATLSPFTITNPGLSFTVNQVFYPNLLLGNMNVYDMTTSQANLSVLGNNGGPTQTMVPLSGSTALCLITPSTATGTDQRGQPRTATVGSTTCQDAGAVQTSN